MSIASEITRLNTAKSDLKTAINAQLDSDQTKITNELVDDYAPFVTSIRKGTPQPPEPTPTSMVNFIANGSTLIGYTGNLSEVVIPKSYSKSETTTTLTGAELDQNRVTTGSISTVTGYIQLTFTDGSITDYIRIGSSETKTMQDVETWLSNTFVNTPVLQSMTQTVVFTGTPITMFVTLCSSFNLLKFPFSVYDTYNNVSQTFYSVSDLQNYINSYSSSSRRNIAFNFTDTVTVTKTTYYDGNDYQITSIGDNVFSGNTSLTKVTVLSNITSIGDYVFENCTSLKTVEMADSVTSIGTYMFDGCSSLNDVKLSNSLTSIPNYTFNNCSKLQNVTIPEAVTSIGSYSFRYCYALSSIYIPKNVTSIGSDAFYTTRSLAFITVDSQNSTYDSRSNCNCLIKSSSNQIITGSGNSTIPSTVTSIAASAFRENKLLTSITITSGVTTIGNYAFRECSSLTTVSIPSSVTSIGTYVFYNCYSLATVTYNATATSIGTYSFYYCRSLLSFTVPSSVTSIGNSAFYGCSRLTTISIPSTVTSIGTSAFRYCTSLQTANIYSTSSTTKVTSASSAWFYNCNPTLVLYIPSSVSDPATTYGTYWNYYASGSTLTYYATL